MACDSACCGDDRHCSMSRYRMAGDIPLSFWPILIPLSVFLCGFFWWRLGDMEWVKSGHRDTLVHKIAGSWGIEVRTAVVSCRIRIGGRRGTDAGIAVSSWWKDLFLGGMQKGNAPAAARHGCAWFYRVFGPTFARWKWIAVSLLVGVLVLGYLNRLLVGMAFLFLGLPLAGEVWQLSSTMLLPEGRREKYYLTIASGAGATLLLIGVSAGDRGLVVAFRGAPAADSPGDASSGVHRLQPEERLAGVPACPVVSSRIACPGDDRGQSCGWSVPLPFLFIALYLMGRELPASPRRPESLADSAADSAGVRLGVLPGDRVDQVQAMGLG